MVAILSCSACREQGSCLCGSLPQALKSAPGGTAYDVAHLGFDEVGRAEASGWIIAAERDLQRCAMMAAIQQASHL